MGVPTLSIGKGGSDTITYLGQLLALQTTGLESRVVFLLSPALFYSGKTTPVSWFLKFVTPDMLSLMYFEGIDSPAREHVFKYLSRQFQGIENPSLTLRAIAADHASLPEWRKHVSHGEAFFFEYLPMKLRSCFEIFRVVFMKEVNSDPNNQLSPQLPAVESFNFSFEEALKKTRGSVLASIGNDPLGFTQDSIKYYEALHDSKWTFPLEIPVPPENSNNESLQDLDFLAGFLESNHINAFFVITPLSPKGYKDLVRLNPLMKEVSDIISRHHAPQFNMWSVENYETGSLADHCHLSELGRVEINASIWKNFFAGRQ